MAIDFSLGWGFEKKHADLMGWLVVLARDTNELPHILSELEASVHTIEAAR